MWALKEKEITSSDWRRFDISELWRYRELFWFLAWRDVKVKYKQTLLGIGWAILQPLALMVLFTLFWKRVINFDLGAPYPVFVYSGLILWELFASGVNNAGNGMIDQANVIKKVYFPRVIVPVSAMLVSVFDFFITLFFFLALLMLYRLNVNIPIFLICFAGSLIIVFMSILGCGLFFAAMNIRYRDVRYTIPFILRLLFFATPIIFPLAVVKSKMLSFFMSLNPMASAIHLARVGISIEVISWRYVAVGLVSSMVLLLVGFVVFHKFQIDCADIL